MGALDQQDDADWVISCQFAAAYSWWLLGYADQTAHRTREALELAQQRHPYERA